MAQGNVLNLQQSLGNQAVQRMLKSPGAPAPLPRQSHPTLTNTVQRLSTDETYYRTRLNEGEFGKRFFEYAPSVKKFLALLSNYGAYYSNNISQPTIQAMYQMLASIEEKAKDLIDENEEFTAMKLRQHTGNTTNQGKVKSGSAYIKNLLRDTLLDDINQEKIAMQKLYTDQEFLQSGLKVKMALFVARAGLSLDQVLKDQNLVQGEGANRPGYPKLLSGGQISEVTQLTYQQPNGPKDRVFKPNEQKVDTSKAGLDDQNMQTALRVLATGKVQALLEAKLEQANALSESLLGKIDPAMYTSPGNGLQFGTATDFATGKEALEVDTNEIGSVTAQYLLNVDFNDVNLKRQAYNLQLMDIIAGQMDRHMGNVKIDQPSEGGGTTKLRGIDNDFAFSTANGPDQKGRIGATNMPDLIDKAFGEAVLSISDEEFWGALQGLRLVEKASAANRLNFVKGKIRELQGQNKLIVTPGQPKEEGQRDWGQIGEKDFFKDSDGFHQDDYMTQIAEGKKLASEAIKKEPRNEAFKPKQIQRKGKALWVIEYNPTRHRFVTARDQVNGSDLWELYNQAVLEAEQELEKNNQQTWSQVNKPQNQNRNNVFFGKGRGQQNLVLGKKRF